MFSNYCEIYSYVVFLFFGESGFQPRLLNLLASLLLPYSSCSSLGVGFVIFRDTYSYTLTHLVVTVELFLLEVPSRQSTTNSPRACPKQIPLRTFCFNIAYISLVITIVYYHRTVNKNHS